MGEPLREGEELLGVIVGSGEGMRGRVDAGIPRPAARDPHHGR